MVDPPPPLELDDPEDPDDEPDEEEPPPPPPRATAWAPAKVHEAEKTATSSRRGSSLFMVNSLSAAEVRELCPVALARSSVYSATPLPCIRRWSHCVAVPLLYCSVSIAVLLRVQASHFLDTP